MILENLSITQLHHNGLLWWEEFPAFIYDFAQNVIISKQPLNFPANPSDRSSLRVTRIDSIQYHYLQSKC